MKERPPQRVVCSALRNSRDDVIYAPRHNQCFAQLECVKNPEDWTPRSKVEQGFVDQYGTFLSRKEARIIALREGQIIRRCGGDEEELYSENLY